MILTVLGAVALGLAALGVARKVYQPPSLAGRPASGSLPVSRDTALGRATLDFIEPDPGLSGVAPLLDGRAAFAARVALIRAAEQSLDIQYYIWQRDVTGLMLIAELQDAADRGVRIRLLLDDHGSPALDADLAALDAHPMIEVRLFNPFIMRRLRMASFLFDFSRLNRRMHNKSLTADGAATIVGGRNIGDIYFAFGDGTHYIDTDVFAVGQIAAEVADDFDRYWDSCSAHPAARILARPGRDSWKALGTATKAACATPHYQNYVRDLDLMSPVGAFLARAADLERSNVALVSDHPAKGLGRARRNQLLFHRLIRRIGQPLHSLDLISAYFVPGRGFSRALRTLAGRGRRVRVLTNSQQATDVLVVHSAYVRYRPRLLDAGVELFELKATRPEPTQQAERGVKRRVVVGSSRSSLHSKSLSVDGQRVFIGSFNFDHRSLDLNTEMGVLIDSPRIAAGIDRAFAVRIPETSYRPRRAHDGTLEWEDPDRPGTVLRVEPDTSWPSRAALTVLGWLPIEWLL
ncbi:phospholipase D family protein [Paracoccus suum]|uniref:Phospholipase D n=1 Tax=Paracoccus suum TaxID=2259340 RepID=A0A344PN89_9RHOB|nr:phospholipase D family protein [Paracoccus suum]AXC50844.1 phospholipase D family protein [Paracoccus suum]